MATNVSRKARTYAPTPKQIVAAWRKEFSRSLKPWFLEKKCVKKLEPKLRKNIRQLLAIPVKFTPKDMTNSLRVARDSAAICKILQPPPFEKKIRLDTLETVLSLTSKHHNVCQGGGGGGGWCDIGG